MREGQEHRDLEKFRENFDAIDFSDLDPLPPSASGHYVVRDDGLVPVEDAGYDAIRQRDATDMRSEAAGISVTQVAEWNKQFKGTGTQFDPTTGEAIFKSRQAKLEHLKARGMVDFNEIKGGPSRRDQQQSDTNLFLEHMHRS